MAEFKIISIATVFNERTEPIDDNWGSIISEIKLENHIPTEAIDGIEQFSHLEIFYIFHLAYQKNNPILGSGHPRENLAYPKTGIFAQRKKDRPNFIGSTIVKLIKKENRSLFVQYLDAINETPVIDIKPVVKEFLPNEETKQPAWMGDLMKNYYTKLAD